MVKEKSSHGTTAEIKCVCALSEGRLDGCLSPPRMATSELCTYEELNKGLLN